MKCQECKGEEWEIVWARVLVEEGIEVDMYQCKKCKRIVMASRTFYESPEAEA